MGLKKYIGKIFDVKINHLIDDKKYFESIDMKENMDIYIQNTGDFYESELIGQIEKCVIVDVRDNKLIGFIINNRKFINDMKRIKRDEIQNGRYENVKDIYLLKRLRIKGNMVGLYLLEEDETLRYFLGNEEIVSISQKANGERVKFKENTIEKEMLRKIKDIIKSPNLIKKEISLKMEEEKEKNLIEKALGLEQDVEITRIATIDLRQEIREDKNKENAKDAVKNRDNINKGLEKIKEQRTIKDVNIKQQMETKDKMTDMKTLGKVLQDEGKMPKIEGKEFVKIGIIESNQMKNLENDKGMKMKNNTTRYSLVAIGKDNSVYPLNVEQDHTEGNNPREVGYQVSQKGQVSQDDVLSRYKIGKGSIAIKNGEYGEIRVYHSPRKTLGGKDLEGNKSLDVELETDNVWERKKEERDLAGEYKTGYRSVERGYKEAKSHEDDSGRIIDNDKVRTKDIDGDINTKTHAHDNVDYNQLAVKWGYYKEGTPNQDKAKEIFEDKRKENPKKTTKEIIEMVDEELAEEFGPTRDRR